MSLKNHFYTNKNIKVIFILNEPYCGIEYLIKNMKNSITPINFNIINKDEYEKDIFKSIIERPYEKTSSENNM
jgi:hypothetical protein